MIILSPSVMDWSSRDGMPVAGLPAGGREFILIHRTLYVGTVSRKDTINLGYTDREIRIVTRSIVFLIAIPYYAVKMILCDVCYACTLLYAASAIPLP